MDEEAVVVSFLQRYADDQESGRSSSVAEYQALYPGFEATIAREWSELESQVSADGIETGRAAGGVAHYRIVRELARGGQGEVHLADDTRLHRQVALKLLRSWGVLSGRLLRRFEREAAVASRLDHPGICAVYDSGLVDDVAYIAMRFVEGESLRARIAAERTSGAPTREQVDGHARLIEQAARALHVAHEAGIVHRDVKPGNIMVTPDGEPVLLDFGLALDVHEEDEAITRSGDLFGTPAYMSPEQLVRSPRALDRRTDVWSLGVTLYELLTHRRPFEAATRESLDQAIRTREPPDPRARAAAITPDLAIVLSTALAKEPDRRYQTALDFADDLLRARTGKPIVARRVSAVRRLARWARQRPAAAALAAAVTLGVPTVTWLLGALIAEQPAVEAQRAHALDERVERHLEAGFALEFEGSLERARTEFEEALRLRAHSVEAIGGLAFTFLPADPPSALHWLEVRKTDVDVEPVLLALEADVLGRLGRDDEARRILAAVPEPTTALGLFLAGMRADARGHAGDEKSFRVARDFYERAVLMSPTPRLLFHFSLAHALFHVKDEESSRRIARSLQLLWPASGRAWHGSGLALRAVDPDAAIVCCQKAIDLGTDGPGVHVDLGLALNLKRRYREAIAEFRRGIAMRDDIFIAHSELAVALCDLGSWEESAATASRALELEPDDANTLVTLGIVRTQQGRADEAIDLLRRALSLKPSVSDGHWALSRALQQRGGATEEALVEARKGVEVEPRNGYAVNELGCALRAADRIDDAIVEFEEAIAIEPGAASFRRNLGIADLGKQLFPQARAIFEKCVELEPQLGANHYWLALALGGAGKWEEFAAAASRAIELEPDNPDFIGEFAKIELRRGGLDRVVELARRAIALDTTVADSHCTLGVALAWKGLRTDALAEFELAVKLDPSMVAARLDVGEIDIALGRYEDAVAVLHGGTLPGPSSPDAKAIEEMIGTAERRQRLALRLDALLNGEVQAESPHERVEYAEVAAAAGRFLEAARLYFQAFAEDPRLVEDVVRHFGFDAGCAAAELALQRDAATAPSLDEAERVRWRQQTLAWLRSDFDLLRASFEAGKVTAPDVMNRLLDWKAAPSLRALGSPSGLEPLAADERDRWRRLLSEVDALFEKAKP